LAGTGLRLGAVNAQALVVNQGGQVGGVGLGRLSTIIKPIAIPDEPEVSHDPIHYSVVSGDTLSGIADQFNLTADELLWSNPSLDKTMVVHAGDHLLVPPVSGLVATVATGDTVAGLGTTYHVDPSTIIDFNFLRDPNHLTIGAVLVIPAGRGKPLYPATTYTTTLTAPIGPYTTNRYPYGWCTWYVATKRNIPWNGDAWEWYYAAKAMGYAVTPLQKWAPQAGAILVDWESSVGHVAYVEQVYPDGSILVSEMNYKGWGVISTRHIAPGGVPLIGFIL
jgi:LysM repeat protein